MCGFIRSLVIPDTSFMAAIKSGGKAAINPVFTTAKPCTYIFSQLNRLCPPLIVLFYILWLKSENFDIFWPFSLFKFKLLRPCTNKSEWTDKASLCLQSFQLRQQKRPMQREISVWTYKLSHNNCFKNWESQQVKGNMLYNYAHTFTLRFEFSLQVNGSNLNSSTQHFLVKQDCLYQVVHINLISKIEFFFESRKFFWVPSHIGFYSLKVW